MAGSVLVPFEHFSSPVLKDFNLMSHVFSFLSSPQDRLSASVACKLWNESMIFNTQCLVVKSRALLRRLLVRFWYIKELNVARCCNELTDSDIVLASPCLQRIQKLCIGHPDRPQRKISDDGLCNIASCCPLLQQIVLSSLDNISDNAIITITKGCLHLRVVSLENCANLSDAALKSICELPKLQEISLKGIFSFSSQGLKIIGEKCPSLLKLCLEFSVPDVGYALKSISSGCRSIQELSLKVQRADMMYIAKCCSLTCLRVEISSPTEFDDTIIAVTAANRHLKELVFLSPFYHPTETTILNVIQNCEMLEKLHINAFELTGTGLCCLTKCRSLKQLVLDSGKGIHDAELQTVLQFGIRLVLLDLRHCTSLSRDGFCSIASCKNLQSLNLSFTMVDDFSLMVIADSVRQLKKLILVKCEMISDAEFIAEFSALESLELDQCPFVNDEALSKISLGCSDLVDISLAFTKVTDNGLCQLVNCCRLQSLNIAYCKYVDGPGISALSKACTWFRFIRMSYRFSGSQIVEELNRKFCIVHLEFDELALVPFV